MVPSTSHEISEPHDLVVSVKVHGTHGDAGVGAAVGAGVGVGARTDAVTFADRKSVV